MATRRRSGTEFVIVVATDGSPRGRAAVAAAAAFPWPSGARAYGLVARGGFTAVPMAVEWPGDVWPVLDRRLEEIRRGTERQLTRRRPGAEGLLVDRPPVEAILQTAARLRAGAIVVGSRGYGLLGRLLLGSVSRGVVRRARCPVLGVKGRRPPGRRVVRLGTPLTELLASVRDARANVLAIGARGAGEMERLLLGSVAEGR